MKFLTLADVLHEEDNDYQDMPTDLAKESAETVKIINKMLQELVVLYKQCQQEYEKNKKGLQQNLGEFEKIMFSDKESAMNMHVLALRTFQDTFKEPKLFARKKVNRDNMHLFEEQIRAFRDCYVLASHFWKTAIIGMKTSEESESNNLKTFYTFSKKYLPIAKKLESASAYLRKTQGLFSRDYKMQSGYETEKMLALYDACIKISEKAFDTSGEEWAELKAQGYNGWKGFMNELNNKDTYVQFKKNFDRLTKFIESYKDDEDDEEEKEEDKKDGQKEVDNKEDKRKGITGKHDEYDEGADIKHDIKFDDPDKFGSKLRSVLHLKGDKKVSYYSALKKLHNVITNLDPKLSREQKQEVLQKFVSENIDELIKELSQQTLNESLPGIRWRRNNRTGLNKVVLTCKANEYKKSLNRDITVSGKKVKDIICLPKSAKPAGERMKNRRSALKRWKTLTSRPAKQAKAKWKKAETRKQSKTIRKES